MSSVGQRTPVNTLDTRLTNIPKVNDAVDFELADIQDIQYMNLMQEGSNDKKIYSSLYSSIAINGVQAVAAGDLEYIETLLNKAVELASASSANTLDLIKICNSDGFNMFHAAVIYQRMEMIHMILEHGAEIICEPTDDEIQDTPLILAIKNFTSFIHDMKEDSSANLDMVACLIESGADVNAPNKKGNTPLIYAVKYQLPSIIELLVTTKTFNSVNASNSNGYSALWFAAAYDNIEIVKRLLSLNGDMVAVDKVGIHAACKYSSERVLQLILKSSNQVHKLVNKPDKDGNTPLMLAKSASVFSPNNIRLLVSHGANLLAFNHNHNRVLHFYSSVDDKDVNEDLLQIEPSLLSHKNYDLETPLHVAAKYGHAGTCFFYAEKGADIYAKDSAGFTPMMNAIVHQCKEVVMAFFEFHYTVDSLVKQDKMLLEWAIEHNHTVLVEVMAETNPQGILKDYYNGSSLIHYVCKIGKFSILKYLLNWDERGELQAIATKADSPLGSGYYPIHIAVKNDHLECVKLLYRYRCDFKTKTVGDMDTALHIAARDGHLQIVKYLFDQGIDLEVVNYAECTPLSSAACTGRYNVVAYLLSIGACVSGSTEKYHTTPLLLACKEGHDTVVKLLLEYSVDVTVANEEGHNCLTEAILNGHSRTALAILNSKYWRKAMQFRTLKNETPMRLLIQHMPDVAEVALYHCVNRDYMVNDKGSCEVTKIEYSYEFLEDYVTPRPTYTLAKIIQDKFKRKEHPLPNTQDVSLPDVQTSQHLMNESTEYLDKKEDAEVTDDPDAWWLQEEYDPQYHPLELMVKYKRTALLMSPVVKEMLTRKWKRFGLPAFIFNLAIYSSFLVLFTAVVLVSPFPQDEMCNVPGCWDPWSSWSGCDALGQCKNLNGNRSRSRNCTRGNRTYHSDCNGHNIESGLCSIQKTSLVIQLDQTANEGGNVTFSCTISSNSSAPIQIVWYDGHHHLLSDDGLNVLINTDMNDYNVNSNLTLIEISSKDAQTYTCSGSDGNDTVTASAMLRMSRSQANCQSDCHHKLQKHKNINCTEIGLSASAESFLKTADVLIIIFSIIQFVLELFQFWRRKLEYIKDFENWVENAIFVLSVSFSACHLQLDCFCPDKLAWTLGILAIFFGWINQVYFLRRLPYTGITISIMYNILYTFAELTVIATLLVFSFSLPFYMLLTVPDRRTSFSTIGSSMMKTLVMMTGEFEFDVIFVNQQEHVDEGLSLFLPELTAIMWVVFIIVMPILFSNLLVGLAVGDTQEERAKAQLTRISLQVRLILELEDTMSVLRYYARSSGITFTRESRNDVGFGGKTEFEKKEAQLVAWEQQAKFEKVQELLKTDPVYEIQESLNQRMEDVHNIHATFIERIDQLEDQLSAYFQHLEQSKETEPDTEVPTLQQWKSRMSLDSSISSSSSIVV